MRLKSILWTRKSCLRLACEPGPNSPPATKVSAVKDNAENYRKVGLLLDRPLFRDCLFWWIALIVVVTVIEAQAILKTQEQTDNKLGNEITAHD